MYLRVLVLVYISVITMCCALFLPVNDTRGYPTLSQPVISDVESTLPNNTYPAVTVWPLRGR